MTFPNAENLASKFCRTDSVITATPLGQQTYTDLPGQHNTWPACRVTRIGGTPRGGSRPYADGPIIQFDVWGGPKTVAYDIATTIIDQLAARSPWQGPSGTLSVVAIGGIRYLPDTTFDPARPRYLFDVEFITTN